MPLFHEPNITQHQQLQGDEAHHATKVLRLKIGSLIEVTNGMGEMFKAQIVEINKSCCSLKILEKITSEPRPYRIEIAVCPTKNIDRMEWFVEKAVEIGVDKISFFYGEHSERKQIKLERIQKIVVAASKQSLQMFFAEINEYSTLTEYLKSVEASQKFIAHLPDNEAVAHLSKQARPNQNYAVMIGPEGDFSEKEIAQALAAGFKIATLGNSRLRTETAAFVACHSLHIANY